MTTIIAGFDSSGYPGDVQMDWLIRNTNFKWCGFYLGPAPSHPDSGWMHKRDTLRNQGWGFAPIFLGQETTGPGSHNVTAAQGKLDGVSAAHLMFVASFPAGSYVFLDLENGLPFPQNQKDYVKAWAEAVRAAGYKVGVYCSYTMADAVHALVPDARLWVYKVPSVEPHPVPGRTFPTPDPRDANANATMWQHSMACKITVNVQKLLVDMDSATVIDPSM